ncbi:hypothetical protein PUV44_21235 [Xanthomonas arboricola pv. corylina]|nr:hypothetical protein PUV44_21235 [Xanthomonas arboricola pv. corylina]
MSQLFGQIVEYAEPGGKQALPFRMNCAVRMPFLFRHGRCHVNEQRFQGMNGFLLADAGRFQIGAIFDGRVHEVPGFMAGQANVLHPLFTLRRSQGQSLVEGRTPTLCGPCNGNGK